MYFSRVRATTSLGDRGCGRDAVPAGRGSPVAHELLVEARLPVARLVAVRRPEARGVGRADLVAECQRPRRVEAELELRVGEDDPVGAGVLGAVPVDGQRDVADPLRQIARSPSRAMAASKSIASSCPTSAFVDGVKIGSGSSVTRSGRRGARSRRPRRSPGSPSSPTRSGSRARCTRPGASSACARPCRDRGPRPGHRR